MDKYIFCTSLHIAGKIKTFVTKSLRIDIVKHIDALRDIISGSFSPATPCTPVTLKKIFVTAHKLNTLRTGAYYEFGVYKGYSLWYAAECMKKYVQKPTLFGFDSFSGLPEPKHVDDTGEFFQGQYACSLESVSDSIKKHGGNLKYIHLIKGFYDKILTPALHKKQKFPKIAIVNIDCDLYESAKTVLNFIYPLLQKNSIIMFDDWNAFNNNENLGEKKAWKEFLASHHNIKTEPLFHYCWHGMCFKIIKI